MPDPGDDALARAMLEATAAAYGISYDEAVSSSRQRTPHNARSAAAWVMREDLEWSLERMGSVLGRDHSTVSTMLSTAARRRDYDTNAAFRRAVQAARDARTAFQAHDSALDLDTEDLLRQIDTAKRFARSVEHVAESLVLMSRNLSEQGEALANAARAFDERRAGLGPVPTRTKGVAIA